MNGTLSVIHGISSVIDRTPTVIDDTSTVVDDTLTVISDTSTVIDRTWNGIDLTWNGVDFSESGIDVIWIDINETSNAVGLAQTAAIGPLSGTAYITDWCGQYPASFDVPRDHTDHL